MGLKILNLVREHALDVVFFIGVAVFSFGFWLAWRPLGFIVSGLVIAAFSFFADYRRSRSDR
jgi:hypothetical protein